MDWLRNFQAKFRQRSASDGLHNTDWALKELRKEIADYEANSSSRRQPEYFIFCTNVVLSPYPEVGGKDIVAAELKAWQKRSKLREYAIWDYDQICTLLSLHDGIRRTFAAWITAGDVLAKVLSALDGARPDFARIASQYVQKEFRRDQFAKLQQAGHLDHDPVPLANVFIDLPTRHSGDALEAQSGRVYRRNPLSSRSY